MNLVKGCGCAEVVVLVGGIAVNIVGNGGCIGLGDRFVYSAVTENIQFPIAHIDQEQSTALSPELPVIIILCEIRSRKIVVGDGLEEGISIIGDFLHLRGQLRLFLLAQQIRIILKNHTIPGLGIAPNIEIGIGGRAAGLGIYTQGLPQKEADKESYHNAQKG